MNRTPKAIALASLLAFPFLAVGAASAAPAQTQATPAKLAAACAGREGWADAAPPARIHGNTWYVGTCGISAILIAGDKGHVLIDGGVTKAAPLVLANIRKAGFNPRDVRWIVGSHEHYDHVGALAALKRGTGAKVAALARQKAVLEAGKSSAEDPQSAGLEPMMPIAVDRTMADGDSVVLGTLVVTAHATPVHAPGSTSWTWQSCTPDFTCRMIAYADSSSTLSSGSYRFTDHPARIADIRKGLTRMAALPCDVLLTPHPSASDMMERFVGQKPLVEANGCRVYAKKAGETFTARLAKEASETRK